MYNNLIKFMLDEHKITTEIPMRNFTRGHPPKLSMHMEVCVDMLHKVVDVFEQTEIDYVLIFGTLLGIYRDGRLIPHDTDIDIAVPYTEIDKFINAIPLLVELGFTIERLFLSERQGMTPYPNIWYQEIFSIGMREMYMDFYFFTPSDKMGILSCGNPGVFEIPEKEFLNTDSHIEFNGRTFRSLNDPEAFLIRHYGPNWNTPILGKHATE